MTEAVAFLLPVLPLLALLACLLLGRYPGHAAVVRVSERIRARSRRLAASLPHRHWLQPRAAHGGLLIAQALCGRAPPA